ncbi:hypothetical protein AZE42_13496 [Rhizopogon vesiculosus]|uniref:Uncharacterized protein n=1 Tax=Rhizopogon vesiculosus TaxID=180088 RepID=A0A1J8QEB0_9AGAM|nr:hypothetical protein AZE42_13496 [Rhizopogon vesiculosus]
MAQRRESISRTMRVKSPTLTVTADGVPVAEAEEWVVQWARVLARSAFMSIARNHISVSNSILELRYLEERPTLLGDAVLGNVTNLGTLQPIVDPLNWTQVGFLKTESQAFRLMMVSAWRD